MKTQKDFYFTYNAYGQIRGNIWMPYTECTKDFSINFSRDQKKPFARYFETLEDIKNHITNDGDFRSCIIDYGYLKVTMHYQNRTITHYIDLIEKEICV